MRKSNEKLLHKNERLVKIGNFSSLDRQFHKFSDLNLRRRDIYRSVKSIIQPADDAPTTKCLTFSAHTESISVARFEFPYLNVFGRGKSINFRINVSLSWHLNKI